MKLHYQADPEVRFAIAALGRTEDIMFSPSNTRLAVAGFNHNVVLVAEVDIDLERTPYPIIFTRCVTLSCREFSYPHGLAWLDEGTLVVGNREGGISFIDVPEMSAGAQLARVAARRHWPPDDDLINSPGSVCWLPRGNGRAEILVCNNYIHNVARHIVELEDDFAPVSGEKLLAKGLGVPDSICTSADRGWIAVSNHNHHCVFVYRNGPALNPEREPDGRLTGINYPHGLRFSADGRFCLVADAGAPCVHVFAADDGDWTGEREPEVRLRILDDAAYFRGATNREEGGPKGLDLTNDGRLLVTTCEEEQIVFTDLRAGLGALCDAGRRGDEQPEFVSRSALDALAREWQSRAEKQKRDRRFIRRVVRRLKWEANQVLSFMGLRQ